MRIIKQSLNVLKLFLPFLAIFFVFIFRTGIIQAQQATYTLLQPLEVPGQGTVETTADLNSYLNLAVKVILGVAGVLAVIMIMIGGIQYLSTDAIGGKSEGREKISGALWGIAIALVSWIILNTINPDLLNVRIP